MFNLYFTDWDIDGLPIANGHRTIMKYKDTLIASGKITKDSLYNSPYFNSAFYFTTLCEINNYSYNFCNTFVDNFIFLIDFTLEHPSLGLPIDLSAILSPNIITNINSKGFLIFLDSEGYIDLDKNLVNTAIALGVLAARILYISGSYCTETDNRVSYDHVEDMHFYMYTNILDFKKSLLKLYNKNPTKNLLYLVNSASYHKIKVLNALDDNSLLTNSIYSLMKLPEWLRPITNTTLEKRTPIFLDLQDRYDSLYTIKKLEYAVDCNLTLITTPKIKYYFDKTYRKNGDLFIAAMANRPFISTYPENSIKEIQRLGYKTFHPFIDESYDSIYDLNTRLAAIVNVIKKLNYNEVLEQTKHITDYNFKYFFRKHRTSNKVLSKLYNIIYAH